MKRNIVIAAVALTIPLVAEFFSPDKGLGFEVLIYWPFSNAYTILVGAVFIAANMRTSNFPGIFKSLAVGFCCWFAWFLVSFLAVGQLHLWLGYKL